MFRKISIIFIFVVLTGATFVGSSEAQSCPKKSLLALRFKDLTSLVTCDTRYIFDLSVDGVKRTMSLTPAMADVKEYGTYTTASIRIPFSGHMVHTLPLAQGSSNAIGYGAIDEHLEITVTRHNPNSRALNNAQSPADLEAETTQAGLSSMYFSFPQHIPSSSLSYFHEFLDISNWKVELRCDKAKKK